MERIVTELIKLDLHIHSSYSESKDGDKVKDNTKENLPVLYQNLKKEKVNLISITDHNTFNFEIYNQIKKDIQDNNIDTGVLSLNLPGVEFDVEISGERIHIISIFDDKDMEKLKEIEKIIGSTEFDNNNQNAFKESTFKDILTRIDLNVVLIAHQKSGIRVKNHNENLSKLGEDEFDEIIGVDYFDALEFRSGRVEGILTGYKEEKNLRNMRFLTGTDCHVWSVYPRQDDAGRDDIVYTYMRSLCSFKGLVMAVTEPSRLQIKSYSLGTPLIKELPIQINKINANIPLSSRINVIIGDNSIGKSLMVEKLFNAKYKNHTNKLISGYESYLKKKSIEIGEIENLHEEYNVFYKGQGGIRNDFSNQNNLKDVSFFSDKFLKLETIEAETEIKERTMKMLEVFKYNQKKYNFMTNLNYDINIPIESDINDYFLHVIVDNKPIDDNYSDITIAFKKIENEIKKILTDELFSENEELDNILKQIVILREKYEKRKRNVEDCNKFMNVINNYSNNYNTENTRLQTDSEQQRKKYKEKSNESYNKILKMLKLNQKIIVNPLADFENININDRESYHGSYRFVTRAQTSLIDKDKMEEILLYPLRHIKEIDKAKIIKIDELQEKMKITEKDKFNNQNLEVNDLYYEIIKLYCNENIFKEDHFINKDKDIITGNSPGKNALIYLDILAHSNTEQIVVIDQPGDDVAQNRISSELINILNEMADNGKQVIIVTHKAELVVNLDADNVIVIKDNDGDIVIDSGALEYEGVTDDGRKINILDDAANWLDGGVEIIKRRWKRYDK